MDADLADRVVLVTGASGGIGGAVARAFRAEGARLVAHYGRHADPARALTREPGPNAVALGADLTKEGEVRDLFRGASAALGPVEILVANAGVWPPEPVPVADMTLERWNETLSANVTATFLCAREFLGGVREHRIAAPAIVLIGSTAAVFGDEGSADYAAAKAGTVYGLCRTLKNEICRLAPRGRVNAVCPGWTATPMAESFTADRRRVRRALLTIPMRKIARPDDVAAAVIYLASDRLAGHVSGEIITVAGGMEGRVLHRESDLEPSGS